MAIRVEHQAPMSGPAGSLTQSYASGQREGRYISAKDAQDRALRYYGIQAPIESQEKMQERQLEADQEALAQKLGFSREELEWQKEALGKTLIFSREELAQQRVIADSQMAVERQRIMQQALNVASQISGQVAMSYQQTSAQRFAAKESAGARRYESDAGARQMFVQSGFPMKFGGYGPGYQSVYPVGNSRV